MVNTRISNLPSQYLGPVATRNGICRSVIGTVGRYANAATLHVATDDIVAIKILEAGAYFPSAGVETALGSNVGVTSGIEYPVGGTVVPGTYAGSAAGVIVAGQLLESDWISVSIPKGAQFRTRRSLASTTNLGYLTDWISVTGDGLEISATALTDKSQTGTITQATSSVIPPVAVLGMTRRGTVALIGDSLVRGFLDNSGTPLDGGEFARALGGAGIGYINLGVSGDTMQGYVASHTLRQQIAAYCSARWCNYGVNDFAAGRTTAQMSADMASIIGYQPANVPFWAATITPKTTGTFADAAGQAVTANEANRLAYNLALRSGTMTGVSSVIKGVIDADLVFSDPANPGKWRFLPQPLTGDGTHFNTAGSLILQSSGQMPIAATGR